MARQKLCCGKCGYFLAMRDNQKELSIKYKDLYIYFEGGILRIICPGCGTRNYVIDKQYGALHPNRVENMKKPHDVVEAIIKEWIDRETFQKTKELRHEK